MTLTLTVKVNIEGQIRKVFGLCTTLVKIVPVSFTSCDLDLDPDCKGQGHMVWPRDMSASECLFSLTIFF